MLNLILQLALKDLKTRYAHLALGFLWAFLSPLFMTGILYLVFSLFLKVKTDEVPFFLYLASATFSWRFFQDSLVSSSTSLMDNKNLIKESKFPHYLIPLSIVLSNALIFLPSLAIVVVISFFLLRGLPVLIIFLPAVFLLHLAVSAGLCAIFSILYVRFRDTKYILEALLPFLFYLTPVFYPLSLVKSSFPPALFNAYMCNPFVGILTLYRVVLLKGFYRPTQESGFFYLIALPVIFSAGVFLTAFYLYKKQRNSINDYLSY